ncbi:MAG: hypothetical protein IKV00_06950 [Clostridia bacterium]|nr:hypothetical protein [Clostridia bacterium]
MKKRFCYTVDDNVRFLKELNEGRYASLFDHPYLAMYRRLHEAYHLRVQLNLFYRCAGFDLSQMTDRYREEWAQNAHWLKLSFHSKEETARPYEHAGYDEVAADCAAVHREIRRFAGEASLADSTTIHFCLATEAGIRALYDNGVRGLLGLYGADQQPNHSYQSTEEECALLRAGGAVTTRGMTYGGIDIILNAYDTETIVARLAALAERPLIKVMIHEQYFYPDYPRYQAEFEQKLSATFSFLSASGYESCFFEETYERGEQP